MHITNKGFSIYLVTRDYGFGIVKEVVLLVVLIALSAPVWAGPEEDAMAGLAAAKKGDFGEAIHLLSRAINSAGLGEESLAYVYNNRGIVYRLKGNYDRAIADYTEAINLMPDFASAYSNRGLANSKKGQYDLAIEDFNRAIDLAPENADIYLKRGNAYFDKGLYDEAVVDYARVIELIPGSVLAYFNRCDAYEHKGIQDKAIRDCTRVIELDPGFEPAREILRRLGVPN